MTTLNKQDLIGWLRESDPERLEILWRKADEARVSGVGDAVHLRGLIEFSNHCVRLCGYCGLRADNQGVPRYRMDEGEIWNCVQEAVDFGYGTVVLQSGEDFGVTKEWMGRLVARIKSETPLAVTLSLGERGEDELHYWRSCGADRYLLRFETSNPRLFAHIHPARKGQARSDRIALLRLVKSIGYETGSGVLIGIPGQSHADLAEDLLTFASLDLDMVGVGPYIPHPETPLAHETREDEAQVPNTEEMTYKMVALTRLMRPQANIPSTTALATLNLTSGRELGLARGANVVMPNLTPEKYRALYEIYPAKACLSETAQQCHGCMQARIHSLGRSIGEGPGHSPNYERTAPLEVGASPGE
jgi:biotin synthase